MDNPHNSYEPDRRIYTTREELEKAREECMRERRRQIFDRLLWTVLGTASFLLFGYSVLWILHNVFQVSR